MKLVSRSFNLCVCGSILFLIGCQKNEDEGSEYIYGVVRNSFTQEPIPFARVGVIMSVSDGLWNSTESVVDTFRTFADGGFRLDRNKYRKLENEGPCSFDLCAAGPLLSDGEIYYDNCAVGLGFNSYKTDLIYCDLMPKAWVRVKVEDSPDVHYHLTQALIHSPYSWNGVVGTYPENYDPHLGVIVNIPSWEEVEIPVLVFLQDDSGEQVIESWRYPVTGIGLDTINLVVEY